MTLAQVNGHLYRVESDDNETFYVVARNMRTAEAVIRKELQRRSDRENRDVPKEDRAIVEPRSVEFVAWQSKVRIIEEALGEGE